MQIILDTNESATVGIHNTERDDFNKIVKMTGGKVQELTDAWSVIAEIGLVQIIFFSTKEKCLACKEFVPNPEKIYCESCEEQLGIEEERERERDRWEDRYDAMRGH